MGRPAIDVTGQRFGRLVVLGHAENTGTQRLLSARCDCGTVILVTSHKLRSGNTSSCGCLRVERTRQQRTTHGASGTALYQVYRAMIARCENPQNKDFADYGGRGITVSPEWRRDFTAFKRDMGPRPEGFTLDRIDANGNYEHGNCRWATWSEQRTNQRRSHASC